MVELYKDITDLYKICRSLTGEGIKYTLNYIKNEIPINIHSINSGEEVFDWRVPKEWNVKDAHVKNSNGETIIDLKDHYLHILNYSIPIHKKMNLTELKQHIYTLPEFPNWIPYRTSYYKENWGFCMEHSKFINLKEDIYEVFIDSTLEDGKLYYGDLIIKGKSEKEILISSYCCHPQQCNDSLSGTVLAMHLAKHLMRTDNYYTYRFIFIPETIGSIVYLHKNLDIMKKNIIGGYVITCVGDEGEFTYLKTRSENQFIDKITLFVLNEKNINYKMRDYNACGSDERQYNYPGVDLNIGSLMKSKYHEFDEYHTSADDLNYVTRKGITDSYNMYIDCLNLIEKNHIYSNKTLCEPFLTKYNLYSDIGSCKYSDFFRNVSLVLKYFDSRNDLIDVSVKTKISIEQIYEIVNVLLEKNIIVKS